MSIRLSAPVFKSHILLQLAIVLGKRESFLLPWIAEGCPNGTSSRYVFSLWEFNNSLAVNLHVVAWLAKDSPPQEVERSCVKYLLSWPPLKVLHGACG